jgi:4-amino-4-deoxy-L-arabinose transferase-like glycosyltransferase
MRDAFADYWRQTAGFLLLALCLRFFFVLAYPHVAGDSPIYEAFARNLLQTGTYSHLDSRDHAAFRPTMIRAPGYPLMIAVVYRVAGMGNETAVRVVQAFLDTLTCLLIAMIVFEVSDQELGRRRLLAQRALFLSALCPFLANYSASILTEVPETLLWTAATLYGLRALRDPVRSRNWFYCGLLVGGSTLLRPEGGLLAGILGLVLILKENLWRAWKPILINGSLLTSGLVLMLLPWTVRNAWTLHVFQPLAPMYAQDQDERVTTGYFDWCRTWLWSYRDVTRYLFPLETTSLPTDSLPAHAGDDDAQREKALSLIRHHNDEGFYLDPESDEAFESMALERRRAHPLRYYITLPILRSLAMWFTPRVEILTYEGKLLPTAAAWEKDPADFSITIFLFLVNSAYIMLALLGSAGLLRRRRCFANPEFLGCFAFWAIILIRTGFFAYFAFPEPRYILEAYPDILVLGAFALLPSHRHHD